VLTSASLMISGEAAAEAISLARKTPTLAVGLHLVVIAGRATLPPQVIPHLVNDRGYFDSDPLRAGLRYLLSTPARSELVHELVAQFERFAASGLPLSHVDGHLHMHLHPTLFDLVLPLAEQFGACGLRLPRDDLCLSLGYERQLFGTKIAWELVFGLLCRRGQGRLRNRQLAVTDRVYGLMQTGRMREAYVVNLLRQLHLPSAEIYFHPDTSVAGHPLGPNPGDLATLLSPAVRHIVEERGLTLATYANLERK
jgi:chitin disaccharide deacetylase